MNDVSEFNKKIDSLKLGFIEIKSLIAKRSDLLSQNIGTSAVESEIKAKFAKSTAQIKSLMLETSSSTNKTSLGETNRRLSIIQHWASLCEKLKKSFEDNVYMHLKAKNEANLSMQSENGKLPDNNNPDEIIQITREKINKQDEMLDELNDLLTITKNNNVMISDEISKHKPMLNEIDKGIDKVNSQIKHTDKKLNQYDKSSSNCFLIAIMWAEIILMILIFFYL